MAAAINAESLSQVAQICSNVLAAAAVAAAAAAAAALVAAAINAESLSQVAQICSNVLAAAAAAVAPVDERGAQILCTGQQHAVYFLNGMSAAVRG